MIWPSYAEGANEYPYNVRALGILNKIRSNRSMAAYYYRKLMAFLRIILAG